MFVGAAAGAQIGHVRSLQLPCQENPRQAPSCLSWRDQYTGRAMPRALSTFLARDARTVSDSCG
jgi:hypothetical protein